MEVVGQVASRVWQDQPEWSKDRRYLWAAPIHSAYAENFVVGYEIRDASADLLYPVGSIVTAVPFAELGRMPAHGEHVIVYRRSRDDGFEVTVREYVVDDGGLSWLIARSSRPELQETMPLGTHESGLPKGITIPLRIIGSFRPE